MVFDPKPDEKQGALDHVLYEIEQLGWAWRIRTIPLGPLLGNMYLESVLVHARTVADFFGKSNRCKDDILATDFGFSARKVLNQETDERINKELAHLTYSRCTRADRSWNLEELLRPMLMISAQFIQHLLNDATWMGDSNHRVRCEALLKFIASIDKQ